MGSGLRCLWQTSSLALESALPDAHGIVTCSGDGDERAAVICRGGQRSPS